MLTERVSESIRQLRSNSSSKSEKSHNESGLSSPSLPSSGAADSASHSGSFSIDFTRFLARGGLGGGMGEGRETGVSRSRTGVVGTEDANLVLLSSMGRVCMECVGCLLVLLGESSLDSSSMDLDNASSSLSCSSPDGIL